MVESATFARSIQFLREATHIRPGCGFVGELSDSSLVIRDASGAYVGTVNLAYVVCWVENGQG